MIFSFNMPNDDLCDFPNSPTLQFHNPSAFTLPTIFTLDE